MQSLPVLGDPSAMETSLSAVADTEREEGCHNSQVPPPPGQLPEGSELRLLSATQTAADCRASVQKV